MPFKFVRVETQRIGLAQIPDDPAILGVVDDRKHLLRGLAEAVEGGAQIFSRQQERSRLRDKISDGPASVGPIRRAHLARIDAAAEPTVLIDDEYFFFFQAEDGIRDLYVTGVQTCALPI